MITPTTADQGLIRKLNTAVILDELRQHAPLSRAELAARTGLNRSTVSIIVNGLVEEGFILETNLQSDRVGRPGMLLVLNPRGGFAVGVEIGVDYLAVLLTDFVAQELWRAHECTDPQADQATILERACELTQAALQHGQEAGLRPLGIGIGVPGLVDRHQGQLVLAPNLQWSNVPMRDIWAQQFGLPVFVENEANAAALGEYYFGAAKGFNNVIYLSVGVGLGGGILLDGKLFRGSSGYASEVGHMTIDPDGEQCRCGKRGCWETMVRPGAVVQAAQRALASGSPSTRLSPADRAHLTFGQVVAAAEQGDPVAHQAMVEVGTRLGIGVGNLINIFNPQLIVLGGSLNPATPFLLPVIEQVLQDSALKPVSKNVHLAAATHGADSCLLGAIALVLDDILREPSMA